MMTGTLEARILGAQFEGGALEKFGNPTYIVPLIFPRDALRFTSVTSRVNADLLRDPRG